MRLFDTHAHLQDERFGEDREALVQSFVSSGGLIMDVAYDLPSARAAAAYANGHEGVYCAVGVHPHDAKALDSARMDELRALCKNAKVRAVGEIGLDYHYDHSPRATQRERFADQLDLASELGLPFIVHDREAHADTLDILKARKRSLRGVLHCFSGSWEMAKTCLDMGLHISLGGPVTFANAAKPADIALKLPLERLLIETDCPYLAPVPYRGKRNEPAFVRLVAERIAAIRGVPAEEIAEAAYENGRLLFLSEKKK